MKTYQILLAGALMFGSVSTSMAQTDTKAIVEQTTQLIKAKGADFEKQVKDLYKANKKNPEALLAIGRTFYNNKDYAKANRFADYALQKNSKCADAFLLKGDICVSNDDAGGASQNYQQAIYFAPKNPEGYYKYAMILRGRNPEDAVATLEDLRKQVPDYPVDALAARIYYHTKNPNLNRAAEYYGKVADVTKMDDEDIKDYATIEWMLGNKDKSIEVAKAGLTKDAKWSTLNRLVFWNSTDKNYTDQALDYADRLFNKSDSAKITADDYAYYGTALKQAKRLDEAVDAYNKSLAALDADANAIVSKPILFKSLSDVYNEKGDFDKALEFVEKSIDAKENPSFSDYNGLGSQYLEIATKRQQAGDAAGAKAAYKKADDTYAKIGEKYPDQANYINYVRGSINSAVDPDSKLGLAKPFYEALVASLEQKADRTDNQTAMLKTALQYMIVYEFNVKKNKAAAKEWAGKMLGVDPTNEIAKQVQAM